jgi:transcriptional regulator with XRE-family HTH domain
VRNPGDTPRYRLEPAECPHEHKGDIRYTITIRHAVSQVGALRIFLLAGNPPNRIGCGPRNQPPMSTVGQRIRQRRTDLGWTQDKLATEAGISKGFLSDLERDERNVSADYLLKISRALGLSLDFLMKGGDEKPQRREVQIPASLSVLAKQHNLTFTQTVTLLDMVRQIVAHRSNSKSEDLEAVDWKKFYEAVKQFLK